VTAPSSLSAERPSPLALGLVAVSCLLAAALYGVFWTPYGADDPWITYRYSENIAAGHGFVYNPGERVMGTSTPLYALVLAGAKVIGLDVPLASWTIGFVAMIASVILLFLLVRRFFGEGAGVLAAMLLATAHLFHRVAPFGMETTFYLSLILGAFVAYGSGRELLASALAGLCLLTRLDGGAVGVALTLGHLIRTRRFPWKAALVYLVVAAPWFIFAYSYFGSLVPNSMVAKRLHTQYTVIPWMVGFLVREPRFWLALGGGAIVLLAARTRDRALPFLIWAALYVGAYSLAAIHRYDWYVTPVLAPLAAGAAVAIVWAAGRFGRTGSIRLAIMVGLLALVTAPDALRAWRRARGDEGVLALEGIRREAALWMRDSLPAGVPIATGGIGLVGYHTGRVIHDAMGLVTPGSMRIIGTIANPRTMPFPRFLPAIIEDFDPEYVFDGFWLQPGETMPAFMQGRYEVVRTWAGANPRWPKFILYHRVGASRSGST
jgi:hypothetical protein